MTTTYLVVTGLVFGALVGSFLNVIALRYDTADSAARGRSHCPACRRTLEWWELIPLVSYVALLGRCRTCRTVISLRYPLIELFTGLGTALILTNFYSSIFVILYLILFWTSIVIILIDLAHMIIPDSAVIILAICGLVLHLTDGQISSQLANLGWGVLIAGGLPAILVISTRGRGMGWGDVKLGAALGLLLGYPLALVGLFLAVTSGAVVGAVLIALRLRKMSDALPFGPFLLLGGFVAILWGERILDWYLGISRIG